MASYRPDSQGVAALLASPGVTELTISTGEQVLSAVEGQAPTASGVPVPVVGHPHGAHGRLSGRMAYDVALQHPAGLRVEARHRPLANGVFHAGLKLVAQKAAK